uniref:RING-type domain-containing protein n=1 Tax=Panagrolaimus sp. ES5 TaxID=591445 RepID=A0AC34GXJ7_9BILA
MSFSKTQRSITKPAKNTDDEQLRHLIKCPVCLDKFTRNCRAPICFPCGHSVCDICTQKLVFRNLICCCVCQTVSFFGPAPLGKNLQLIDLLEHLNLLDPEPECDHSDPPPTSLPLNAVNNIQEHDFFAFFKFCTLFMKKLILNRAFRSMDDAARLQRIEMLNEAMILCVNSLHPDNLQYSDFYTDDDDDEGGLEYVEAGDFDFQYDYHPTMFPRFIIFSNERRRVLPNVAELERPEIRSVGEEIIRHFLVSNTQRREGSLPTIAESHREEEFPVFDEAHQRDYIIFERHRQQEIPSSEEDNHQEASQEQELAAYQDDEENYEIIFEDLPGLEDGREEYEYFQEEHNGFVEEQEYQAGEDSEEYQEQQPQAFEANYQQEYQEQDFPGYEEHYPDHQENIPQPPSNISQSRPMQEYRPVLEDLWQNARPHIPQIDTFQPDVWNPRSRLFHFSRHSRY